MPATKNLTIAALLAVTVSVAGCNSKKASSADSGTATTSAAAAPAASAVDSGASTSASAPGAAAPGAGAAASGGCALTAAQVTTVMGSTYGDPQNLNGACYYTGNASLSIDVENASDRDFDAALAAAKESQQTDKTPTTIPGLGDKAAFVQFEIVVAASGKTIVIRADSSIGNDSPKLVALAKLVIAGLH